MTTMTEGQIGLMDLANSANFRVVPHRTDPRGAEYGSFELSQGPDGLIEVRHTQDDYTVCFRTAQDFRRWAQAAA